MRLSNSSVWESAIYRPLQYNKMNRTNYAWTPYPNVTCIIGLQALIGLNIPCCLVSWVFNSVIFYVLSFRVNFTDRFILSLTIADLLTSILSQPVLISVYLVEFYQTESNRKTSFILQRIAFFLNCITCAASSMSLGFVVMARYIQIKRPLRHEQIITMKRLVATCIFIWTIAVATSFIGYVRDMSLHVYFVFAIACLSTEALTIGCINISIISITRSIVSTTGHQSTGSPNKAMKTIIIITFVFTMSTLPFGIVGAVYFVKWPSRTWGMENSYYCDDAARNTLASVFFYSVWVYHTTCMSNPLVYTLRDTRIKSALKKLLKEKIPCLASYMDVKPIDHIQPTEMLRSRVSYGSEIVSYTRSKSIVSTIGSRHSVGNYLGQ